MAKRGTKPVPFWDRVDKAGPVHPVLGTPCWWWTGAVSGSGYGAVRIDMKQWGVHCYAWYLVHGDSQPDLEIDHLCLNKLCVNPDHLELVTPRENTRRAVAAGVRDGRRQKACKRGHLLEGDNLYLLPNGGRRCKKCVLDRMHKRRAA